MAPRRPAASHRRNRPGIQWILVTFPVEAAGPVSSAPGSDATGTGQRAEENPKNSWSTG